MYQLKVDGLTFQEVRANFEEFLKGQDEYRDWNFKSSAISALIDVLAYNIFYTNVYTQNLLAESFIDSAKLYGSLLSKAKLVNYLPGSKRSARAKVRLKCYMTKENEPKNRALIIDAFSGFTGQNAAEDTRTFVNLEDVVCYDREVVVDDEGKEQIIYTSPEFYLHEGSIETWKWRSNDNHLNERFTIKEERVDIDTVSVKVDEEKYMRYQTGDAVDGKSKVFFVDTGVDGYYSIFFGNGVYGAEIPHNSIIEAKYLLTNGKDGNGCISFAYVQPEQQDTTRISVANAHNVVVETIEGSTGGREKETTAEMRHNIPYHWRMQNRVVTENDYKNLIMQKFRDVASINVWGGERNSLKDYKTIFVCIKPISADLLSTISRNEIIDFIKQYSVIGQNIRILDPEFLDIQLTLHVEYDELYAKEKHAVEKEILKYVDIYNEEHLDKFDIGFDDNEFLSFIRENVKGIKRISTTTILHKTFNKDGIFLGSVVNFHNPIEPDSFRTLEFRMGNGKKEKIVSKNNELYIGVNKIGTVDNATGVIRISSQKISILDTLIDCYVVPKLDDIKTHENNVLRISSCKVEEIK